MLYWRNDYLFEDKFNGPVNSFSVKSGAVHTHTHTRTKKNKQQQQQNKTNNINNNTKQQRK